METHSEECNAFLRKHYQIVISCSYFSYESQLSSQGHIYLHKRLMCFAGEKSLRLYFTGCIFITTLTMFDFPIYEFVSAPLP